MKTILLAAATIPLAACATTYGDDAPAPPSAGGTCNAEAAQSYVGNEATPQVGAAILEESGARTLRWGPPNSAWTMDYRQDRVNVRYDEGMTITEITCG